MWSSLNSLIMTVKPRITCIVRGIYQKTFSAKDRIAFYDMLAFCWIIRNLRTNRLQHAFIDMRNVVTDFCRKYHPL